MNDSKMFEIDPKLFVTCRLCLEKTGAYRIVPSVQKQIKFCYEIEIDPYDALPQLICKDCETTLRTYFEVKTNYIEKQKKIREKLQVKMDTTYSPAIQREDDIVTSSQEICSEGNNVIRKRIISYRSSLSEASDGNCIIKIKKKRRGSCESSKEPDIFELGYKKWFICRFCNHQSRNKSKIIKHINTHSSMIQKYTNLINRDCYVKLDKVDNKLNICKSKKYVVHSSDKITHFMHNFYHVIIRPKETSNNRSNGGSLESSLVLNHNYISDDSNDTIPIELKNRRRKNRILSNDTVVIEKNDLDSSMLNALTHEAPAKPNVTEINEKECISIDDSDTESIKSIEDLTNGGTNLSSSVNNSEYKTINNIISLCFKRHLKRLESNDTIDANIPCHTIDTQAAKLDSHLKHKVLSIGKKMINNSPFSCTGILRYLEHQNLEIVWTPNIPKTSNKKSDCVRIMMKLKSHDESDVDFGWTVLQNPNQVDRSEDADSTGGGAVLSAINVCQENDKILRKLLNENPVPNPKKLTKKAQGANLSVSKKKKTKSKEDKSLPLDMPIVETAENLVMPLITSTVSLAPSGDGEKQQPALPYLSIAPIAGPSKILSNVTDTAIPEQANFPRIKVKSASQLMSNPALNVIANQYIPQAKMFAQSQNVNMAYQNSNDINMNIAPLPRFDNATGFPINASPQTLLEINSRTSMPMSYENKSERKVVMNSVDLPNTTTTSPFMYFKTLLQIHNIYLLTPDEIRQENIRDFICLLKFKLTFQQVGVSPVPLCLALFNWKVKFFIKVKDVNDAEIDICQLSPNWQWEILKVYAGEVVPKMYENAEKVSPEVLMTTRNFVRYLKCIEFQK